MAVQLRNYVNGECLYYGCATRLICLNNMIKTHLFSLRKMLFFRNSYMYEIKRERNLNHEEKTIELWSKQNQFRLTSLTDNDFLSYKCVQNSLFALKIYLRQIMIILQSRKNNPHMITKVDISKVTFRNFIHYHRSLRQT